MQPSLVYDITFPPLPQTQRATPIVLGSHPEKEDYLYCNENNVVIRNLKEPSICKIYKNHQARTYCARYTPSGNYISSGDDKGRLHIWSINPDEIITKYNHQLLNGPIKDVAWAPDGTKLVAVGGSGSCFASFSRWDSENKISDVSHSSKAINSVDFSSNAPFRCCMASEDQKAHFVYGPKLEKYVEIRNHSSFVQCCRFTRDGRVFITGGSDSKLCVFDGMDGSFLRELSPPHKGGIYAVAVSPDSRQILTSSGDKTAAIYDIETGKQVQSYKIGTALEDMQLGCLWEGEYLLSVSLSGFINYLDFNDVSKPCRIVQGHKKAYTSSFAQKNSIFLGSYDGRISKYNIETSETHVIGGKKEVNVHSMVSQSPGLLLSFGIDNSVRAIKEEDLSWIDFNYSLPSQPFSASSDGEDVVVGCANNIVFLRKFDVLVNLEVKEPVKCCSISKTAGHLVCTHVATKVYEIPKGRELVEQKTLPDMATLLKYSPKGDFLAAVVFKDVIIMSVPGYEKVGRGYFGNSSTIVSLDWSPDGRRVMSASIDSSILIWDVGNNRPAITFERAHSTNPLISSFFLSDKKVASVGSDTCLSLWTIK